VKDLLISALILIILLSFYFQIEIFKSKQVYRNIIEHGDFKIHIPFEPALDSKRVFEYGKVELYIRIVEVLYTSTTKEVPIVMFCVRYTESWCDPRKKPVQERIATWSVAIEDTDTPKPRQL